MAVTLADTWLEVGDEQFFLPSVVKWVAGGPGGCLWLEEAGLTGHGRHAVGSGVGAGRRGPQQVSVPVGDLWSSPDSVSQGLIL